MGNYLTRLFKYFTNKEELRILLVGLDAAGKTTILNRLRCGETTKTVPTIGFNVEIVEFKNIRFTVWDIGGQARLRPLWHHYFRNTAGIIFVIDAQDDCRIGEAVHELRSLLCNEELKDAVLMIMANKQDLPHAMSCNELTALLSLHDVSQTWNIIGTCAINGSGLYDGLECLREMILQRRRYRLLF